MQKTQKVRVRDPHEKTQNKRKPLPQEQNTKGTAKGEKQEDTTQANIKSRPLISLA